MHAAHKRRHRSNRLLSCLLAISSVIPALTLAEPAQFEALSQQVANLEQRVERVRDVESIEVLISAYGYYLDKALWDQVTDLFIEDGTLEISLRGVYRGKPSIRKAMELFGPQGLQQDHLHNHIQMQPLITIADDGLTARSRHRAVSQLGTFGRDGVLGGGVYENEYVKENGVWKFKSDHVYTTFFAMYSNGFTGGRAAPKPSADIPPDSPSTVIYEAYPGAHLPAFHYRHPVTGKAIPYVDAN